MRTRNRRGERTTEVFLGVNRVSSRKPCVNVSVGLNRVVLTTRPPCLRSCVVGFSFALIFLKLKICQWSVMQCRMGAWKIAQKHRHKLLSSVDCLAPKQLACSLRKIYFRWLPLPKWIPSELCAPRTWILSILLENQQWGKKIFDPSCFPYVSFFWVTVDCSRKADGATGLLLPPSPFSLSLLCF